MMKHKLPGFLLLLAILLSGASFSKDKKVYNVTAYGAVDSRTEYSTPAIQKAIDDASAAGGGQVYVPAGCYLISPIQLKSNVELYLEKGATLLGSPDRARYNIPGKDNRDASGGQGYNSAGERGLIWASGAVNIAVRGAGTVDGQGEAVAENTGLLIARGVLTDRNANGVKQWVEAGNTKFLRESPRPQEENRPMLFALYDCKGVTLDGIHITNAAAWVTTLWRCDDARLLNLTVRSRAFWNNDGIDLVDCTNTLVKNCDVDSADDGICLKSYGLGHLCENITVENCTVCSSASAIKFGTASTGGFRNITIRDIEVKNTFRSAVAIESVDGGIAENIVVKNVRAVNTWNAIFLVAGTRKGVSTAKNVTFENVYCEIPATRPDVSHQHYIVPVRQRNPYPALVTGSPASAVENVKIKGLKIVSAGGGSTAVANTAVADLAKIMDGRYGRYPEYDMFGELPAWGLLCRNVNGLQLENVEFILEAPDYRAPVVIDRVQDVSIRKIKVTGETKTPLVLSASTIQSIKGIVSKENQSGKDYEELFDKPTKN
jgi:hypothetical protein